MANERKNQSSDDENNVRGETAGLSSNQGNPMISGKLANRTEYAENEVMDAPRASQRLNK